MLTRTAIELEYCIEPEVQQYCGPVFFTLSRQKAEGNVIANGSFGLVDTGSKKVLVTCHHVWKEFQEARLIQENLEMCISLGRGPLVVLPPGSAISEDRKLDIATFDMEPLLGVCGGRKFYPLNLKPPRTVKTGDMVFFIGFQGHHRHIVDGALHFGVTRFGVKVSSVDGWDIYSDISELKMNPEELGGISGCPCFRVRPGKPTELAGFVKAVLGRYLCFTHANCLKKDGTITKQDPFPYLDEGEKRR